MNGYEALAAKPRACIRCHQVKVAVCFPAKGRTRSSRPRRSENTGVTRICWTCVEEDAYATDQRGFRNRNRRTYRGHRGTMRICTTCEQSKPLADGYYVARRFEHRVEYARECKRCATKRSAARRAARKKVDPEYRKRLARQQRERLADPEKHRKALEASKRWKEKIKADPIAYAAHLETARINHRLRRERKGAPVRPESYGRIKATKVPLTTGRRLPSAPLVALVKRTIEHREAIAGLLQDAGSATVKDVCADLGIADRDYRRMCAGEQPTANIGLVERVLLNADVEWHTVYSYDDYARIFLAEEVAV